MVGEAKRMHRKTACQGVQPIARLAMKGEPQEMPPWSLGCVEGFTHDHIRQRSADQMRARLLLWLLVFWQLQSSITPSLKRPFECSALRAMLVRIDLFQPFQIDKLPMNSWQFRGRGQPNQTEVRLGVVE